MSINNGFDLVGKCFKLGCKDGHASKLEQRLSDAEAERSSLAERLREAEEVIAYTVEAEESETLVIGLKCVALLAREYQKKYLPK